MLASAVLLGLAVGMGLGGDWRRLLRLSLRGAPILFAAALLRVIGVIWGLPLAIYVVVLVSLVAVALMNWRLPGALVIAAGITLNLVAILANGGMPISPRAAAIADIEIPSDGLHMPMTEATRVSMLADVVPVPFFRNVYSAGDIVLAVGGFWLPFVSLRR